MFHEFVLDLQVFCLKPSYCAVISISEPKNEVAQKKFYDLGWPINVYDLGYGIQTP